jgi:hypothetical protein
MSIYARIQDGLVAELFTPPGSTTITDCFHAGLVWNDVTNVTPAPQPGWTATETNGTWSYAAPPAPPGPTPEQQAATLLAEKLAAGLALTSTGAPALNGTYALDATSTAQIFQIGLYASQFATFPSGGASQPYPDTSGTPHVFSVAEFIAFLKAVAPLVSGLTTQAGVMAQGGTPNWPSQTAVI